MSKANLSTKPSPAARRPLPVNDGASDAETGKQPGDTIPGRPHTLPSRSEQRTATINTAFALGMDPTASTKDRQKAMAAVLQHTRRKPAQKTEVVVTQGGALIAVFKNGVRTA